MASATDIITYIGVPLAVLGVLPILYTFALAILTQRRIRAALIDHGHRPISTKRPNDGFTIRSSPMTSLIEVELPKYVIAPLERNHENYWQLDGEAQANEEEHHKLLARAESTLSMAEEGRVGGYLRGGSWRAFHWKRLIVGKKLFRIQYEDELREPAAEIDFGDLVNFLLDWGAVPDAVGWDKLRSGGLWTPAGTILLRKADDQGNVKNRHADWVLRTTIPDENDGMLSLTIKWSHVDQEVGSIRGPSSLPPGWGRLRQPIQTQPKKNVEEKSEGDREEKMEKKDLLQRIEDLKTSSIAGVKSNSIRFHVESGAVNHILWESGDVETGTITQPFRTHENASRAMWFTCVASAILGGRETSGALWGFDVPAALADFCQKETVPCGVLVLLGLIDEADTPAWSSELTVNSGYHNGAQKHMNRHLERMAAQRLEASMSPEQRRVAEGVRRQAEMRQMQDDARQSMQEARERDERRMRDAITSPKFGNKAVAEACLAWLIEKAEADREWTVEQVAEAVLYLLVVETNEDGEAAKVMRVLGEWMSWTDAGGLKKQQVDMLQERKLEFCLASCLVATLKENKSNDIGKAGEDMLECLKTWRKVRLG